MGEQDSISGVWREALAIIRRYPAAVVVPGGRARRSCGSPYLPYRR